MNYNQLLYFITTVKYNSITKAAKELYISQPGISYAIKALEEEFHTPLFIRKNNVLTLTPAGRLLYDEGIKLIDNFNELNSHMHEYIEDNRTINIGVPPMIGTFLFPKIFNEFKKENKDIKLVTNELSSISLIKALRNNEIDLAITSLDEKAIDDDIKVYNLLSTDLVFCVAKGHHLAHESRISISMLKNEPLVLLKEDSYQHVVLTERFEKEGIIPNTILTSNQLYTIKQLLSYNEAGAFMFKEIVDSDPDLIGIELNEPIKVNIALICSRKIKENPYIHNYIHKFIDFIQNFK